MKICFEIKYVPEDKWIGLYVCKKGPLTPNKYYLCLIPCFPIIWGGGYED